jgi:hypothetical protein
MKTKQFLSCNYPKSIPSHIAHHNERSLRIIFMQDSCKSYAKMTKSHDSGLLYIYIIYLIILDIC